MSQNKTSEWHAGMFKKYKCNFTLKNKCNFYPTWVQKPATLVDIMTHCITHMIHCLRDERLYLVNKDVAVYLYWMITVENELYCKYSKHLPFILPIFLSFKSFECTKWLLIFVQPMINRCFLKLQNTWHKWRSIREKTKIIY